MILSISTSTDWDFAVQFNYLMFVQSWEMIVAKQNTELFFFQRCRQLTEAVIRQLRCRCAQKLFRYQCYSSI